MHEEVIKSISYSQTEILQSILKLREIKRFDCDATYGKGNFYKNIPEPKLKFDLYPSSDKIVCASADNLPLADNSLNSIVFDPPFLATKGPSTPSDKPEKVKGSNKIIKRFGRFDSEQQLFAFYYDALKEFHRVLKVGGCVIFKCQDKVSSGIQYWSHCEIYNDARELGFYLKDLFILLAKVRMTPKWQLKNQKHARKYHSYFLILQK